MANYLNPLDNFRSYSYHFILTVANSTEALRKSLQMAENGGAGYMQAVTQAQLGGEVDFNGSRGWLLIDTRRYTQFTVTSYEASHIYGTGKPDNPSWPSAAAKMRLLDTTGLSFFNFLMDVMRNKLQSTRASAFFMLAIVFTGHTDDYPQQTVTVSTSFTPLILTQLGFEFTSSGSVYDIEFFEVEGNPGAASPQMIDLGDIQSVTTDKRANTVGGMLQALEDRLNIRSLQFYQKYSNEALKSATDEQKQNFVTAGKLVQYMISLPEDWRGFALNTAEKSKNVEQVFLTKKAQATKSADAAVDNAKKSGDKKQVDDAVKARDSIIAFSSATNIQDAIKVILESSTEYLKLASTERAKAGTAIVAKTVMNITSDDATYVLHFDIYPEKVPKPKDDKDKEKEKVAVGTQQTQKTITEDQLNLIKYDYLFTGRNSHITDLKINFSPASAIGLDADINIGGQRFAENAADGQKPSKVTNTGQNKTTDFAPQIRPGEPIFIPMKTKDQQTNYAGTRIEEYKKEDAIKQIKARQEHTRTIASLNFMGMLETTMTVRGNPNIIRKYADRNVRGGIAPHSSLISTSDVKSLIGAGQELAEKKFNEQLKSKISSAKDQYYKQYMKPRIDSALAPAVKDELLNGADVSCNPLYVKVNIMAPNVDFLGNFTAGDMFTNKFFYTGAYKVTNIRTTFDNGEFRHQMTMIPFDVDGSFSESASVGQPTDTPNKKVV